MADVGNYASTITPIFTMCKVSKILVKIASERSMLFLEMSMQMLKKLSGDDAGGLFL